MVETHFNSDEEIPVILLGLQIDVRGEEDYRGTVRLLINPACEDLTQALNGRTFLYAEEGIEVAKRMRCDTYCECSALSGQVCHPPPLVGGSRRRYMSYAGKRRLRTCFGETLRKSADGITEIC